ncbi:MAG: HAMP domain-containing sensor histidine kinase [Chloroflexota bacterium]|jgi:signal transduction histidine kinase
MFRSLRSRLLITYLAVIAIALLLMALALLAISATQSSRILPTLRQLRSVAQGTRRELAGLVEQGATLPEIRETLTESASDQGVRILLLNRANGLIIFDSQEVGENWTGTRLEDVVRPRGEFTNIDPNLPVGRYRAPDGSSWLVFPQALASRTANGLILLIAQPEPTILQFFRENFFRPLCFAGLIAFLLSLVLAALIARSVTQPLQRMASASQAIAQGDYDQQLPLSGPEEVQQVAGSFNSMASQVAATQQAQRDFLTNVSHDLKTPLTSIRGWSQALLDGTATDPNQQQRAAAIINDEASRMERMVSQLLVLARIESGQLELAREAVDLQQLLTDVENSFALQAQEKGVAIRVDAQPAPPIFGDYDRLRQALTNLVDNALGHTGEGDEIRLRSQASSTGSVEIMVQDTGSGIPQEELNRLFERFYQVDKSRATSSGRRSSGLGLSIVKELVEAHGGRIEANSQVGLGSTFTINLPTNDPPQRHREHRGN